jgi:hypothetical protein
MGFKWMFYRQILSYLIQSEELRHPDGSVIIPALTSAAQSLIFD